MDDVVATAAGLVGALLLTPLARRVAIRFSVVDRPGDLKTQRQPVPYLGGMAVFLAAALGPLLAGRAWLLIPMALALLLGLADDVRPLPVAFRVGAELVIAIVAAIGTDGPTIERLATGVLVLGLLNAVNLLDGQDGLVAGAGTVMALGFAVLGGTGRPVALGLAGALAGFLVFNRPPARIYLGDAGAYLVGTSLALMPSLTAEASVRWSTWWAVPLLVGVPVADTALAIIRRARARRPLLGGDRSHVYDQLVDRGLTVGQSTLVMVAAQVVFTGLGLAAAGAPAPVALGVTLAVGLAVAVLAVRLRMVTTSD